jgi:hypothetical protein
LAEGENPIPPIIGAAYTRRGCRKRNPGGHPRPQRKVCSLPPSPLQMCPTGRHFEALESNNSGLRHARYLWQFRLHQKNLGSRLLYSSKKQVTQLRLHM